MIPASCPRCGGTARRQLAPGYYECASQVLTGVVPRGLQGNVTEVPVYGVCGHAYQEGTPQTAATCACGMFAVGECKHCGTPVCGQHGRMAGQFFVCQPCHANAEAAAQQQRAATEAELARDRRRRLDQWRSDCLAQLANDEPVDRLMRVVAALVTVSQPRYSEPRESHGDWATMRVLLPDVHFTDAVQLHNAPPWDHRQIERWFLDRAPEAEPGLLYYQRGVFGTKARRAAGWHFAQGATAPASTFKSEITRRPDVALLADGRRVCRQAISTEFGFNITALHDMATLVGVQPLP